MLLSSKQQTREAQQYDQAVLETMQEGGDRVFAVG